MNTSNLLKKNRGLERQIEKLIDLIQDLFNENSRRSDQIEDLLIEKIGIRNMIIDIYFLLLHETEENNFLEINPKNLTDILNDIRVLIKVLLLQQESLERENYALRDIIKGKK